MTTSALDNLKTLPEVAQSLGLTYQGTYGLITSGRLPARLFAGRWLVTTEDLRSFMRERERRGGRRKAAGLLSTLQTPSGQ